MRGRACAVAVIAAVLASLALAGCGTTAKKKDATGGNGGAGSTCSSGGGTAAKQPESLTLTIAKVASVAKQVPAGARVLVTEVDPKSAAAERGFKEGDVILEVGGKSVATAGEVRDAITAARTDNKNSVLMRVKSGGQSRFVAVPLAKG